MKEEKLQRHLETNHPGCVSNLAEFFEGKITAQQTAICEYIHWSQ